MQQHDIPLESGRMYHIYNRGINGANIFLKEENYNFFLTKYAHYLSDYVDTFAYCLLKNHFHLLIRVKETFPDKSGTNAGTEVNFGRVQNSAKVRSEGLHHTSHTVSKQFARLFSSYTQSINKVYERTGGLMESPFKRKLVESDAYFSQLLFYIHVNPRLHGFTEDFTDYPYSSYHSHLLARPTRLCRDEVIAWFGNPAEYRRFHQQALDFRTLEPWIIEV